MVSVSAVCSSLPFAAGLLGIAQFYESGQTEDSIDRLSYARSVIGVTGEDGGTGGCAATKSRFVTSGELIFALLLHSSTNTNLFSPQNFAQIPAYD